ncbi:MAG: 50S ribosomal protein L25 [Acidimicrobiaceae bacterium]|nr:50S ribosomal protein L25 [Acidimicrobiaceae bacterium]
MSELVLAAKSGRSEGSPASRRLRLEGQIPGVVYGASTEPVQVSCNSRELRSAMSKQQLVGTVIQLELDGTKRHVVIKEIQRHPVRPEILHIDFQVLNQK